VRQEKSPQCSRMARGCFTTFFLEKSNHCRVKNKHEKL